LPLRPLVFGGDDVTVVCDGRLGLTFAATYLEEFERAAANLPDGKAGHACAGVAIIKTHYPFARAYALAEELCDAAKQRVRHERSDSDASALDWHFAATGIAAPLDELRQRLYTTRLASGAGSLVHRPLLIAHQAQPAWGRWHGFTAVLDAFGEQAWRDRRNKLIALREALRAGPEATRAFRVAYAVSQLPAISGLEDAEYRLSGWVQGATSSTCAYFDAVEALEFYLPLPAEAAPLQEQPT